jgi:hypothetical protein
MSECMFNFINVLGDSGGASGLRIWFLRAVKRGLLISTTSD